MMYARQREWKYFATSFDYGHLANKMGSEYFPRSIGSEVKENQEKDKIGSKPDENGKHVEAGKSLKQLQLKEEEKPKKTKKEWSKTHTRSNQIEDPPILELNIVLDVLKGSHVNLRPFIRGIEMEQKNIQERSVLSIDYHRPFIQVTAVSIEFFKSSMPMR
nr:dynamin-related protein 1E-like [Tanacetum cinerariifolium]